MAPVVRLSEDVFRRLQRISVPLVDTPSQVIDRLLTHYESSATGRRDGTGDMPSLPAEPQADLLGGVDARLFIAPASEANLALTIRRTVPLATARALISETQLEGLNRAVG